MTQLLNRRRFLAVAGAAGAGALAAACGNDSAPFAQTAGSLPGRYSRREHVIVWHSFGGELQGALQKLADDFNAEQRDVYVELQFQGNYEFTVQKLATAVVAKQIPDLVTLSEITWRKMHLAGALEPLNRYFDSEMRPENYVSQFIDEGTVKGTTWWIPFARSTPIFYYNKDVLTKVGLRDRGPQTWEELRELAPAIMRETGKKVFSAGSTYASWMLQSNIWTWGGNYSKGLKITLDQAPAIAAAQWMVDFIRKDKAAYLTQTPDVDFTNRSAATTITSTGSLKNISGMAEAAGFKLGTTFLPEHDGNFGCPTGGSGFGIMRSAPTERKEAAWRFLKFLARPERSAEWTMASGYMPVIKAAQKSPELVKLTERDPNFRTSLEQLPRTEPQDLVRPLVSNAGEMLDQGLQKLYSSGASVEQVFGRLAKQLQNRADLIEDTYQLRYH